MSKAPFADKSCVNEDHGIRGESLNLRDPALVLHGVSAIETASPAIVRRSAIALAFGLWIIGITAGTLFSFHYATTPTETGAPISRWPAATRCTLSKHRPTLLMFVHPRCPCTRASLDELRLLVDHCAGRLDAQVILLKPQNASREWAMTDLWESAALIPGATRRIDLDGHEHRRFGARVSGEVFLYQPNGELVFHGGMTAGRGHAGPNRGRTALEVFLNHHDLPTATTSVFGCELESHHDRSQKCETNKTRKIDVRAQ